MMTAITPSLAPFAEQHTVLLTTFRRDGTPVGTPVGIVVDGPHAYVRSWSTSGKAKRIRNNPEVQIAPSTFRGRPTGPAINGRATLLRGEEAVKAGQMLRHKYPWMHGILVPLAHRLRRLQTVHFEIAARCT